MCVRSLHIITGFTDPTRQRGVGSKHLCDHRDLSQVLPVVAEAEVSCQHRDHVLLGVLPPSAVPWKDHSLRDQQRAGVHRELSKTGPRKNLLVLFFAVVGLSMCL